MSKETVKDVASAGGSANTAADNQSRGNVCVVDMGKQSRKRIKALKRGKGKLMSRVDDIVDDLVAEEVIAEGAAVVVVVVRKESSMMSMFDDD